MPISTLHKTNFTAGEVSKTVFGRTDLRAFENGASTLCNVFIHPTGGVTRRHGMRFIDTARGRGRLVAFEFNTEQVYLIVLTERMADIYRSGVREATVATPWSAQQLRQINWTQSADTLLVVHPEVPPKTLHRTRDGDWQLTDWIFHTQDFRVSSPHFKFADSPVTLQPSATRGRVRITASAPVFVSDHVGARLRLENKEVEIAEVISATLVWADVKEDLSSLHPTTEWTEQAFSAARGWPATVCFHQDRLVIGGSRDLPNVLWLSRSSDLFNFDLGEGLDDESIQFQILSDQVNAIRHVFSGRHLQVFTSGAEWMVAGDPLTPSSIQVHRQTRLGSPVNRTVPPRDVDGATLFIPRIGAQLREFLFSDTEQAYQASDLGILAEHIIDDPIDMDFDKTTRLLHIVMSNGSIGTLTVYRDERVTAWTRLETCGAFISIAAVGRETYVLVERPTGTFIEVFDRSMQVDSGLAGSAEDATARWSGADHLEGEAVKVVTDDAVHPDVEVTAGEITLEKPARRIQAGLAYRHVVEPLPPSIESLGAGQGARIRPIAITFRLLSTGIMKVDLGRGIEEVTFKRFGEHILDGAPKMYSGDKTVRAFGWRNGTFDPLWRIEQDTPLPFTLLSVSSVISTNR